jgi:hypothetical protein
MVCPVYMDILDNFGFIDETAERVRVHVLAVFEMGGEKYATVEVMKTTLAKACGLVGAKDDVLVGDLWGSQRGDTAVPWEGILDELRPSTVERDPAALGAKAVAQMKKVLGQCHAALSATRMALSDASNADEFDDAGAAMLGGMLDRLKRAADTVMPPLPKMTRPSTANAQLRRASNELRGAVKKVRQAAERARGACTQEALIVSGPFGGQRRMGPKRRAVRARLEVVETELVEAVAVVAELRDWKVSRDDWGQAYFVNTKTGDAAWEKPRPKNLKALAQSGFFSGW